MVSGRPGRHLRASRAWLPFDRAAAADRRGALALDRGPRPWRQLAGYRRIASVEQILLVASEDRHAEVWLRAEDGWKVQDLIGDAALPLALEGQPLPLAAVYDGVAL